ncbi:hypothetical protein V6N00_04715 [Tersicoccus sp. MR15.9]|uniref:hypothetical protein n=1 Tax=Tersicoccus mangrovi TaxID=3121635 RepID=UPI002FE56492
MTEHPQNPTQYATRRERRAAERAAEEAAARTAAPDATAADAVPADEVDDDGVAFGAGAALTREEYEARMAELAAEADEHAVSLSRHGARADHPSAPVEHEGAEHAGPEHVDPQVRAEQEAMAARAASLNAAQRGTAAGPAVTDAPVTADFVDPPQPDQPHNLGAVTPLRYQSDPAFDFPVIAPPTTSMLFLTVDPETGRAQPLHPVPVEGTQVGDESASASTDGGAAGTAASGTTPPDAAAPASADSASSNTMSADTASTDAAAPAAASTGPATGWVPTADLLDANAPASDTTGAGLHSAPPVPVGASDAAGLDPLDSRTARQGRRSWVGALIGGIVVVAALAVLAVVFFVH